MVTHEVPEAYNKETRERVVRKNTELAEEWKKLFGRKSTGEEKKLLMKYMNKWKKNIPDAGSKVPV